MLEIFRDVTAENPTEQVWKFLRVFLSVEYTEREIRNIHAIPEGKFASDVKKQAIQIGYCIRQAEEYFKSSSRVSLATRPTMLYYGAVSLSRALVLLRQNGDCSFDVLRKNNRHNHHGLDFDRGLACSLVSADGPEAFFSSLRCSIHCKPQEKPPESGGSPSASEDSQLPEESNGADGRHDGIRWGHMPLFYQSLVPCAVAVATEVHNEGKSDVLLRSTLLNCAEFLPITALVGGYPNALDLLRSLPDMFFLLRHSGIKPSLCEGDAKLEVYLRPKADEKGVEALETAREVYHYYINNIVPGDKDNLLDFYRRANPRITLKDDFGRNLSLESVVTWGQPSRDREAEPYYFPDMVDDINNRKFYILEPEHYVPEPATHLILLYCLGMMSRYYPDIWMKSIDKDVMTAELTDSLLSVIYRRFPNLILDQMTQMEHFVHL